MVLALAGCGCQPGDRTAESPRPPLADTLVSVLSQLTWAAWSGRPYEFATFLDSAEAGRLTKVTARHGFASLPNYLRYQFANWPDPDTLIFADLTQDGQYARIAFKGAGLSPRRGQEVVRYTFALFKLTGERWKLAAVSSFDKPRFDQYGTEWSYLETELPPRLRFPRHF